MIIYDPSLCIDLSLYGINVPLKNDRTQKVVEILHKDTDWNQKINVVNLSTFESKDLKLVHHPHYIERLFGDELDQIIEDVYELKQARRFNPSQKKRPFSDLFQAQLKHVQGTYQAVLASLVHNFCFFLGGGMHHAHYDFGRGFCLINDCVLGLRKAQSLGLIKNAWIIDVDAHFADGTSELIQNDPSIRLLSIHMQKGWPLNEDVSFAHPDIEIAVSEAEESLYNQKLKQGLERLADLSPFPDVALVVDGSDPYEKDALESASLLKLSKESMLERDLLVFNFLQKHRVPMAYVMSGGYGPHAYEIYVQFLLNIKQQLFS